jgi:hypothetical protein
MNTVQTKDRGRAHAPAGIDAGFLRRVHRTGIVLSLFISLATAVYVGPRWGLGFLACSMWSVANLWAMDRLLRSTIRPEGTPLRVVFMGVLVKIPLLYGALIALLIYGNFPAGSILLGLGLPLVVIVMKVAGQMVASKLGASDESVRPVDPS